MNTLYMCGAGNPEGVRLALTINQLQKRWKQIVILDDDPAKQGNSILGVEIAGPFEVLKSAEPDTCEVVNLVAMTTKGRQAARRKIQEYGLPFASLLHPDVETLGVDLPKDITVYREAVLCAGSVIGEGAVVFSRGLVGHGSRLGCGCVVAPGAVINARVELDDGVYVGTNSSILPDLKVGPWATIGANSAAVHDVPAETTVMGVPAEVVMGPDREATREELELQRRQLFTQISQLSDQDKALLRVLLDEEGIDTSKVPMIQRLWEKTEEAVDIPPEELESRLQSIWQRVLGRSSIGVNDNFFEVGGHSLLAAQLFARIEGELGVGLPLATLLHTTIKRMTELLRQEKQMPGWASLVPIQVEGSRPPLFLVHGAEGNVLLYRDLARHLGSQQPVYGLQSAGLDGSVSLESSFETMAEKYLEEVRSVQRYGPYHLGGYCLGGTIAFEMARQLLELGEEVALIFMIENYNLNRAPDFPFHYRLLHKLQNVKYHWDSLWQAESGGRLRFLRDKSRLEVTRMKINLNVILSKCARLLGLKRGLQYHHLLVEEVNEKACMDYVPEPMDAGVTVFKPRRDFAGLDDPSWGWSGLGRKGVDVVTLPINPKALLNEPFVEVLAGELNQRIKGAAGERQTADRQMVEVPSLG